MIAATTKDVEKGEPGGEGKVVADAEECEDGVGEDHEGQLDQEVGEHEALEAIPLHLRSERLLLSNYKQYETEQQIAQNLGAPKRSTKGCGISRNRNS